MAAMNLEVVIGEVDERPESLLATVTLRDERYEKLLVVFDYLVEEEGEARLHGVRFEPRGGLLEAEDPPRLTPALIRDFPMSQWDRIAQAAVRRSHAAHLLHQSKHSVSRAKVVGIRPAIDRSVAAPLDPSLADLAEPAKLAPEDVVRLLEPGLNPEQGPGARRRWNSLIRYASIFTQYEQLLAGGVADPITELAQQNDVAKATVRSWLHRAREAGVDKVVQAGLLQQPLFPFPDAEREREDRDEEDQ